MVTRRELRQVLLGRDVATAYAIIVALYALKFVRFQPIQIPPYLLIAAYDFVEVAVPMLTPYHPVGFPLFLYLLAVIGAGVARWFRPETEGGSIWLRTAGGICLVVGMISILFGAFVGGPLVSATDNPTPLAITGATGVILLVASWWLLGHPTPRSSGPL